MRCKAAHRSRVLYWSEGGKLRAGVRTVEAAMRSKRHW